MAITKATLSDFSTLLRVATIFAIGGAVLGACIGWNTVCGRMPEPARTYANRYAIGKAMNTAGLTLFSAVRRTDPVIVFQTFQELHSDDAEFIEVGIQKAFLFPWPGVGALAGLGLLVLASSAIDFLFQRTNK